MFETTGVMLDYTSIETIRNTSLGIEGWALCNFGTQSSPSDDDDNDDLFPEDHGDNDLIKNPSAPLGNGSPLREAGEKSFIKNIAPVAPLVVGQGPMDIGHRRTEGRPLREAPDHTQCVLTGEMSIEDQSQIKTRFVGTPFKHNRFDD